MAARRKLFCEYGPLAFWISTQKCRWQRRINDLFFLRNVARGKNEVPLPETVAKYETILHRDSPLFNQVTETNKKFNIILAYPKFSNIVIRPGETFSFWKLLGKCTKRKGYKTARMLIYNRPAISVGGGLCQIPNLIHYLALHSMLTVAERHDHDWADLYPEFGSQVPFGTGTSVLYNYRDLRLKNNTSLTYQIIMYIENNHLCGELRSCRPQAKNYRLETAELHFTREDDAVYRNGKVLRHLLCEKGKILSSEVLTAYHAKLLYDASELPITIKEGRCESKA